jgi:phosphoribosyl-ATP pyrophosphohydrolase
MKTLIDKQKDFMNACGQKAHTTPTFNKTLVAMWTTLVGEEFDELIDSINIAGLDDNDRNYPANMANVCAEAVDLVYVTMGLMNAMGLPFNEMFEAIHDANMDKVVDGKVIRREDGKILKPKGWMPADKLSVINEAW